MTSPSVKRPDLDNVDARGRRRGAKRWMDSITIVCVSIAIALGTSQLVNEGLQEFLNRPPGVGATPSDPEVAANPSPPQPQAAARAPSQPTPTTQPADPHQDRHHRGSDRYHRDSRYG